MQNIVVVKYIEPSRVEIVHRTGLKNEKFLFFISISVIFICWWIFKDNEENQELYIKKDDF